MAEDKEVQAFVCVRPTDNFASDAIELLPDGKSLNIHAQKDKQRGYINNQILNWNFSTSGVLHNASQEEVYNSCAAHLVTRTLDGYNGTIFAYGQTGGGKTYSMTGTVNDYRHRGIIPRALAQLFKEIGERHEQDITARVSYLEIYKEEIFDLLCTLPNANTDTAEITVTEDNKGHIQIKGLTQHCVKTEEEALNLLFEGDLNRVIGEHQLNHRSSRSHCIFMINVESRSRTESNTKYTLSKLNLVDLAGSERLKKTNSTGFTETEAMHINRSLTFLEQTAIALEDKRREHVPFRQSKLTHVLKDAFGGRCNTVMLANIYGESAHLEETLSTLRFASRVMNIVCVPAVNDYIDPMRLAYAYEQEIKCLREELAMYDTLTNRNQISYEPLSDVQISDIQSEVTKYVDDATQEIPVVNLRQTQEVFRQFRKKLLSMEESIEQKLREKYNFVEKGTDPEKNSDSALMVPSRPGQVGESDEQSFGAGKPGAGVKVANPSAMAVIRKQNKKQGLTQPDSATERKPSRLDGGDAQSPTHSANKQASGIQSEDVITKEAFDTFRPCSPPSKEDAFEQYKNESGSDLNGVLNENKDVLREKVCEMKQLTTVINATKHEIDCVKEELGRLQQSKENTDQEVSSSGEPILDQDEFLILNKLKGLKQSYRSDYAKLKNKQADVNYCETLVAKCREKLLEEFEQWYTDCFCSMKMDAPSPENGYGLDEEKVNTHPVLKLRPCADGDEQFDAVRTDALSRHQESMPFYNARMQTEKRRMLHGTTRSVRPGSVQKIRPSAPPNTLLVQA